MDEKLKRIIFNKTNLKYVQEEPGVYLFYDNKNIILYIGKAKSLKVRIRSYFDKNLFEKTDALVKKIKYFSILYVSNEIEAILLEANLIKKHKPYYNISLKDDKGPSFVYITNNIYPTILLSRKVLERDEYIAYFGPFHQYEKIINILKSIRKMIPYSTHLPGNNVCIYRQMKLCNPCPSEIEKLKDNEIKNELIRKYKNNISDIKSFFNGKFNKLKKEYIKLMNYYSSIEYFEEANYYKSKIDQIDQITSKRMNVDFYSEDPYISQNIRRTEINNLIKLLLKYGVSSKCKRIECYDISHISGYKSTGSMVTFVNGIKDKKYYRHFRLNESQNNDIKSLNEIARRRINHIIDWGKPDLIIVDGGKAQVNVFLNHFSKLHIPVVGIAKRLEKLIIPNNNCGYSELILKNDTLNIVSRIRDEAHRFAKRYHHTLISKSFLNSDNINIR